MILFQLKCAKRHEFEAWFKDGKSFDGLAKQGKLLCPVCGNRRVEKAPMAPRIAGKSREAALPVPAAAPVPASAPAMAVKPDNPQAVAALKMLRQMRKTIEENCDAVGDRFAEEARKIHYGETKPRGIYGQTTAEEAEALTDEGIEFGSIPWLPRHDS